ncbi:hypothetical protein CEXT_77181 [Caerostris extrusa]|uniref:Uncharacterized protein n=1 Tax=Caerostris extrusa TaxID=172846 RepID=A0AAV4P699_CAEEX|nr:hypothetical protein CEXT_77181 [Caerostris extrusa]
MENKSNSADWSTSLEHRVLPVAFRHLPERLKGAVRNKSNSAALHFLELIMENKSNSADWSTLEHFFGAPCSPSCISTFAGAIKRRSVPLTPQRHLSLIRNRALPGPLKGQVLENASQQNS